MAAQRNRKCQQRARQQALMGGRPAEQRGQRHEQQRQRGIEIARVGFGAEDQQNCRCSRPRPRPLAWRRGATNSASRASGASIRY